MPTHAIRASSRLRAPLRRWLLRVFAPAAVLALGAAPTALRADCPYGGFELPPSGCYIQNQQCFPDASGPAFWLDPNMGSHTTQIRTALQSAASNCHTGPLPTGQRPGCSCQPAPGDGHDPTVSLRLSGTRILVDYEAPNYYCVDTGDWPPGYTCTNSVEAAANRISLFDAGGYPLARAYLYYEKGTWDTGVDVTCGGSGSYEASIKYQTWDINNPKLTYSGLQQLTAPSAPCPPPDRHTCPAGGGGGAPTMGVGRPINVGSGDVSLSIPFFTLAQPPLSLGFTLSYHSSAPVYPSLVPSPAGVGWIHPFAQVMKPIPSTNRLLHVTAEGFEHEYTQSGGSWIASKPGELRGTVTLVSGEYRLTDLDGTVTAFDATTGAWKSTTDRWGNALTGTYSGGNLTALTDSVGRQLTLAYTSGLLTQITLPSGGVWRLEYQGTPARLWKVYDPIHDSSTPWRSFEYQADAGGTTRLLTAVRDDSGVLLEGHTYEAAAPDRGLTSYSAGNRDLVTVEYDVPISGMRRVTHRLDATTNQVSLFTVTYQAGRWLPLLIDGSCASCGGAEGDIQSFAWSADNYQLSRTDGLGHVTTHTYDTNGNVLTTTEAHGTPLQRTTTYEYTYTPWPRFRTKEILPSVVQASPAEKTTTWTWTSSTVLTRVDSGYVDPLDVNPTTLTTTTTFDAAHRLLQVDGPRTDVTDTVVYEYYPLGDAASRRGRLYRVTDAAGNPTTFDNYDDFGTARQVTDANGVVTDLTTDAGHGWLS